MHIVKYIGWISTFVQQNFIGTSYYYRVVTICMHIFLHMRWNFGCICSTNMHLICISENLYALQKKHMRIRKHICILDEDVFLLLNKHMHLILPMHFILISVYTFCYWLFDYSNRHYMHLLIAYAVLTNMHYMQSHNPIYRSACIRPICTVFHDTVRKEIFCYIFGP